MRVRQALIQTAAWAAWAALAAGGCSKPADKAGAEGAASSSAAGAAAPGAWPSPPAACAFLDGRGYRHRGYKAYEPLRPDEFTCQSLNRKVGGGTAVVGEAGFYYSVVGGPDRAEYMRLRVDVVRGGADETVALDEFASTTAELAQRAFQAPLPDEAAAALRAGAAGKWPLGEGHELKVERKKESGGPFGHVYSVIAELR